MKIRNKILLLTMFSGFLLSLLIVLFVNTALNNELISDLREKGIAETKQLANLSMDDILTDRKLSLKRMVNEQRVINKQIEYVFIKDEKNNVIAHTFGKIFPRDLKDINSSNKKTTYSVMSIDTSEGEIIDIAMPIANGELGVVHVGFTGKYIKIFVDNTIKSILLIIAIVLTIVCVLAFVFSSVFTRPIRKLSEAVNEIGEGNLDIDVDIKSNDEIGELANSFNNMIENLKILMKSADNRNKKTIERNEAEERLLQSWKNQNKT